MTASKTGKEKHYQHREPQRDLDHEPKPKSKEGFAPDWMACATCGQNVYEVDETAGPESLKARFRF